VASAVADDLLPGYQLGQRRLSRPGIGDQLRVLAQPADHAEGEQQVEQAKHTDDGYGGS
jgi:hypothetical protein